MQSMILHVVLSLFIAEDMDLLYLAANNGKRVLAVKKYKFIFFPYNEKSGNLQPKASAVAQHSDWNPWLYLALPSILPVAWQFAL